MVYSTPAFEIGTRRNVEIARRLYREAPLIPRFLLQLRPHICPFEAVMAHVPPGSRVLDLGCGGGLFLGLLAATRHGIRGYGVDTSRLAIEVAESMARTAKEDGSDAALEFAVLDVAWQLPDGFFDVVALIDVAHHLPRDVVRSVLRAAAGRVRSDGGLLIYKDMSSEPLWQAAANRLHDLIVSRQWVSYYPIELVESILRGCGLEVVHSETLNRFWYRHDLRVLRRDSHTLSGNKLVQKK